MPWRNTGRALVVGLGNPGSKYAFTRHNIGFMLAEAFAELARAPLTREKFNSRYGTGEWAGRSLAILQPQTFMNRSGQAIAPALSFFSVDAGSMVALHDDLDLPLGDVRVKIGGGHGGHNGLRSIIAETGQRDFVRVRLGIGRPPGGKQGSVTSWVLGRFGPDETALLDDVFDVGIRALQHIFESGPKPAMNEINGLYRSKHRREGDTQ